MPDEAARVARFGLVVFLLSESMLFAGFVGGFIVLHAGAARWLAPEAREAVRPCLGPAAAGLLGLLAASGAMAGAARIGRRWPLALAFPGGAAYLAVQGWEWSRFAAAGIAPGRGGAFASAFVAGTGLQALHVAAGLVLLLGAARAGSRTFGNAALFWHFTAGFGLLLFALLWGSILVR